MEKLGYCELQYIDRKSLGANGVSILEVKQLMVGDRIVVEVLLKVKVSVWNYIKGIWDVEVVL